MSTGGKTIIVSTRDDLLHHLEESPGSVIYIDDSAEIDLTGIETIHIPGNTTLKSGRGKDGSFGGLLFTKGLPLNSHSSPWA